MTRRTLRLSAVRSVCHRSSCVPIGTLATILSFGIGVSTHAYAQTPIQNAQVSERDTFAATNVRQYAALPASCARTTLRVAPDTPRARVALKLGVNFSPSFGGSSGLDVSVPKLGLGQNSQGRFDLDVITFDVRNRFTTQALFGPGTVSGTGLTLGLTFNEIYVSPGLHHPYIGAGVGYYSTTYGVVFGDNKSGLGGKVFGGYDFTSTTSAQLAAHLTSGPTLLTMQIRLKL